MPVIRVLNRMSCGVRAGAEVNITVNFTECLRFKSGSNTTVVLSPKELTVKTMSLNKQFVKLLCSLPSVPLFKGRNKALNVKPKQSDTKLKQSGADLKLDMKL